MSSNVSTLSSDKETKILVEDKHGPVQYMKMSFSSSHLARNDLGSFGDHFGALFSDHFGALLVTTLGHFLVTTLGHFREHF